MKFSPTLTSAVAVAAALILATPAVAAPDGSAARSSVTFADDDGGRGRDRWDDRDDDRWDDRDDDDRWDDDRGRGRGRGHARGKARQGNGPPFCRNGQGHPRWGMSWCVEKGWAPRYAPRYRASYPRWREVDPGYIVFDRRSRVWHDRRTLGERILDDLLGDRVFRRLVVHRSSIGLDGRIEGRWYVPPERYPARVLQVRAGRRPLAEFVDVDGDGRVDVAFLVDRY